LIVEGAPSIDIVELGNWSAGARDQHVRDAFIRELSLRLAEACVRATEGPTQDFGCQRRQRYLLVGSFLCVNDVLYINVSLADPQSNRTVFADSYKDDRDSILKLGRTVSDGILSALNPAALFA
jgi:TolB-like protein